MHKLCGCTEEENALTTVFWGGAGRSTCRFHLRREFNWSLL